VNKLRIVGIGGGTGLPVLLEGLLNVPGAEVSAIVTVADNGGSSGRLRDGFGIPAVGDLRNCLVALSGNGGVFASLFQHRFREGDLDGHALGNLIVTALYQQTGSLDRALEAASLLLLTRGRALDATELSTTLCASFEDGSIVRGECQIAAARRPIERVWLEPESPPPSPGVVEAIRSADAVVLAPGSLYTSLVPNLLVGGVADAIRESAAVKIFVCNLMTQPGETDGYTASDHLRVAASLLGFGVVQFCVVNSVTDRARMKRYAEAGSEPVVCDTRGIRTLGAMPVKADLLQMYGGEIRHDPGKLAMRIGAIARAAVRRTARPREFTRLIGGNTQCIGDYAKAS